MEEFIGEFRERKIREFVTLILLPSSNDTALNETGFWTISVKKKKKNEIMDKCEIENANHEFHRVLN